jgi:hypothetical protein
VGVANGGDICATKERPANLSGFFGGLVLFAAYHSSLDFHAQVRSGSGTSGICGG